MQVARILQKEENLSSSISPNLDIASEDLELQEAKENVKKALELLREVASSDELPTRHSGKGFSRFGSRWVGLVSLLIGR